MCANKLPTIIFCKFKFLRLLSHVTYDFSFSHTCNVDCTKYIDMYMLIGTAFSEFLRELTFNFNTVDFLHLTPTTHIFSKPRADHDDQDVVMFNRIMLPSYYGLLRMCCQQSRTFTRQLAQHQNIQWAFKNISCHPAQYTAVRVILWILFS